MKLHITRTTLVIICLTNLMLISGLANAQTSVTLKLPPTSLSQWYKPENKRQVWLHTMFRLRRSMQAIESYAQDNDQAGMKKWAEKLETDYKKIADMVPEWEKEIKPRLMPELHMFIERNDTRRIKTTLDMIQRTCNDCHDQYQPLVTAIYRSPEYDTIKTTDPQGGDSSFDDQMDELSKSVNHILIALEDGYYPKAQQASQQFQQQLDRLGQSCQQCHQEDPAPRERILGSATEEKLKQLTSAISSRDIKASQKHMGEIGVMVCARCHNTHRILSDLREAMTH